jgi:hypothetical protein
MSAHHDEKRSFEDDVKSTPDVMDGTEAIAEVYNPNFQAAVVKSNLNAFSRRSLMVCIVLQ